MPREWTSEGILELSRSFQNSQPLLAAAELGVFDALGPGGKTAAELSEALGTAPRASLVLLNALAATGLLIKDGETFRVPEDLAALLTWTGESAVLPMVRHMTECAHRWDTLAEVVRTGRRPERNVGTAMGDEARRAFILGMHVIGREMADRVVAVMAPERFRRALDVGGASGTYTMSLLRAAPEMRATLFDLPGVVEMARERLEAEGLLDRVELVAGDFYVDPLPGGHDMVLLSAIIHQNSPEHNRALYGKCLDALAPGGTIVIRDIIMDDTHTRPPGGTLFAINMLVGTEGGRCYSFAEIESDLASAGFVEAELVQRGTWMDGLVAARRPE